MGEFLVTITGCVRCGKDHPDLPFLRLNNPADEYGWWGTCPETSQPILLKVVQGGPKTGKGATDPRRTQPL